MEIFLKKYTLSAFWLLIIIDCVFLYFDLPYIAITEPLLIPILLLFLFLNDENIGRPIGKFIFYIGLLFSFFSDVLQLVLTNGFFFSASLIMFILMNICYIISFITLNKCRIFKPFLLLFILIILLLIAYQFLSIMGNDFGDYLTPFIIYISTLILMFLIIINLSGSAPYSKSAIKYFIPGAVFLIIQNMAFTINLFRFNGTSRGYIYSLIFYAAFQYLMVKGFFTVYQIKQKIPATESLQGL